MKRRLQRGLFALALGFAVLLAALALFIWRHAQERIAQPPMRSTDAALVLGNRAYIDGRPNLCLTHRVDRGVELWRAGLVQQLAMSGSIDREDSRIEVEVMAAHARQPGYGGVLLKEALSPRPGRTSPCPGRCSRRPACVG